MAAIATQSLGQTANYPAISDRIWADLRQQQRQLLESPERAKPAAELFRTERFIFRTKPEAGIKRLVHTLDAKPEVDGPEDRRGAFNLARWEKRHKDEPGYAERMERFADVLGGRSVVFQAIPRHSECWFATDDPELAAYLRGLIKDGRGDFAHVYETNGQARLIVGNEAFPNSALGWEMARRAAQAAGIADIKIVEG